MNWYLIFYLFSIVENLGTFFGWMCVLTTIIFAVSLLIFIGYKFSANTKTTYGGEITSRDETDEDKENLRIMRKWLWYSTPLFVFFWLAYIATPSKKDVLLIIAGGAVGEFVTTDANAKALPADITKFLRAEILKATAELGTDFEDPNLEKIRNMSREELEKLAIEKLDSAKAILK